MMKRYGISIVGFMCLLFSVFMTYTGAQASQNSQNSSKYAYEISGGYIRKADLSTGKVTTKKIDSNDSKAKYCSEGEVVCLNGDLYYSINTYNGSDNAWNYLCKVSLKGKGFKVLDKGYDPHILKNRIYYTKVSFNTKDSMEYYSKDIGVYSMKGNGSSKKCLVKKKSISLTYGDTFFVGQGNNEGVICQYSASGKLINRFNIGKRMENISIVDDMMYAFTYIIDEDTHHLLSNGMTSVNLITGEINEEDTGKKEFIGKTKNNEYYYEYNKGLFIRDTTNNSLKKITGKGETPVLRSNDEFQYCMFRVNKKGYELTYNILLNVKNGKVIKLSGKYCR